VTSIGTKITILVDNNALEKATGGRALERATRGGGTLPERTAKGGAPARLASEHGLAFWIESAGQRVLFDTGQGPSLASNAPALGVDLAETDILVLSHGHYDHTGGVAWALRQAHRADVYCHPGVFQPRYAVRHGKAKAIGIRRRPFKALEKLAPERLHWVLEPVMLTEHIGITGPIPRSTGYEDTGGPFYLDRKGWRPDPLEDDLALWIRTDNGLVVCFGCAHAGAVNTLDYVRGLSPGAAVRAVIGGFHLVNASEERLSKTIAALQALQVPLVVPCHCTGADAFRMLAETLGEIVVTGATGMTFQF